MAAKGYPGKFKTSNVIYNLDKASKIPETNIFHMGTKNKDKQFITTDGRVLAVTSVDKNLDKAIKKAYKAVNIIKFEGSYFRTDIAESGYALKDVKSKMLDKILKLVKINF
jgi:phosphoribosylamine--glycine ligase